MNIKSWFENLGCPIAETAFIDETPLPSIVYLDEQENSGSDNANMIIQHTVSIEYYSETIDKDVEKKIEGILDKKGIPYTKERAWVDSERFFMTSYDLDGILEKRRV